jgi:hypothetical protein
MATLDDINSTGQGIARQIGALVQAFTGRFVGGTFTLTAATTTVVAQTAVKANSVLALTPTNATAALTQRSAGLYHSANAVGASFSVSTQSGTAFGTETFEYILFTPT